MVGVVHRRKNPTTQRNNDMPTEEYYQYESVADTQESALLHNPQVFLPNADPLDSDGWTDHYNALAPDEQQIGEMGSQYRERGGNYHHNNQRETPQARLRSVPDYRWKSEEHIVQTRPLPLAPQPVIADTSALQMMMLQQQLFLQQAQLANQVGGGGAANSLQLQMIQAQIATQNCQNGGGSMNVQNCGQQVRQAADIHPRIRPRRFNKAPAVRLNSVPNHPALPPLPSNDQWEGWQEATIILCLLIMAGIYMTVNASAAAVKPATSNLRSSTASKSSSSGPSSSATGRAK